jgi:hypothetical protein
MTSTSITPCPIFSAYRIDLSDANSIQDIGSHSLNMSESITPKLVLLQLKGQKIIHILSPTARTTRQARKNRKKKKKKTPRTQQQLLEQGGEEAVDGTNKNSDG